MLALCLAAGAGRRFMSEGFDTPKPFLKYKGRFFFEWALGGVPQDFQRALVLQKKWALDFEPAIQEANLKVEVLEVGSLTRGPLETALQVLPTDFEGSVLILDCDLMFEAPDGFWSWEPQDDIHLLSFTSDDPRYSFARMNSEGNVVEIAEKMPISNCALAGAYYFRNSRSFRKWGYEAMRQSEGEPFVSHALQCALLEGASLRLFRASRYLSFGTPEEWLE